MGGRERRMGREREENGEGERGAWGGTERSMGMERVR